MGEQVAGAAGYGWFDGVAADLEGEGYASRAVDIPACAVDAPHIRSRLYWVASDVADACRKQTHKKQQRPKQDERERGSNGVGGCGVDYRQSDVADADLAHEGDGRLQRGGQQRRVGGDPQSRASVNGTFWSDHVWLTGADGKARRAEPSISLLAHGIPARVGRLRAYGNAIVPQLAAEVVAAFMDCET
jgi:DNA (cytosine-5)-methyltransferase 1